MSLQNQSDPSLGLGMTCCIYSRNETHWQHNNGSLLWISGQINLFMLGCTICPASVIIIARTRTWSISHFMTPPHPPPPPRTLFPSIVFNLWLPSCITSESQCKRFFNKWEFVQRFAKRVNGSINGFLGNEHLVQRMVVSVLAMQKNWTK